MRVCECKTLCEFIANKTHHSHSIPPLKDQQQHWYCATISVETHSTSTAIRNAVRQPNSRSWPISSLSILSLSRSRNQFRMNVGNRCCRFLCVFVYLGLFSRFNSTLVFLLLLLCRVCVSVQESYVMILIGIRLCVYTMYIVRHLYRLMMCCMQAYIEYVWICIRMAHQCM